jgi:hypothetical protein
MKLISHIGNLSGPNLELENTPTYIDEALDSGYDVEVDVWHKNDRFYLGHDLAEHKVPVGWFLNRSHKLWIHCKNHEAFQILLRYQSLNIFWHQTDDFALTSKGYVWCYPGIGPLDRSVAVMPELDTPNLVKYDAICSDEISLFKGML